MEVRNGYIVENNGYLTPFDSSGGRKTRKRDVVVLIAAGVGLIAGLLLGTMLDDRSLFTSLAELSFAALWINDVADKSCKYPEERIKYRILPGVLVGLLLVSFCFTLLGRTGLISDGGLIVFWIFFIIALVLLFVFMLIFIYAAEPLLKKKRCTGQVMAFCIGNVRRPVRGGNRHFPVWEYSFGGIAYTAEEKKGSLSAKYSAGDPELIYVNPHDPGDTYRPDPEAGSRMLRIILGISAAVLAVLVIDTMLIP